MKLKRILAFLSATVALILECLPYGAVLKFAVDEGKTERKFFSFFDLTVYGNGNFFPFLTGILTVLLVLSIGMYWVKKSEKAQKSAFLLAFCGTVFSLFPAFLYGLDYLSPVSGIVTGCLLISTLLLFQKEALK